MVIREFTKQAEPTARGPEGRPLMALFRLRPAFGGQAVLLQARDGLYRGPALARPGPLCGIERDISSTALSQVI